MSLPGFTPPPNFENVASQIEGITVFAPRPETPPQPERVEFKCPNCGAATRFDVSAGGVACEHCSYQAQTASQVIGLQAKTSEFTLEALSRFAQGWGTQRRVMHCNSCGGDISMPEGALSITCPFCASNEVNLRSDTTSSTRPGFLIPFKIQPQENASRLRAWLSKGWFHPENLTSLASTDQFVGIYLPFWTFDAQIQANWKAEVGYERQVRYYDHGSKGWRTRTEIDWVWKTGQVHLDINSLLITGTSHISHRIAEKILPFDLDQLVAYAPDYLAGWQALAYDIDLPTAWERGKAMMREKAKTSCYHSIDSPHVRNFSMNADFSNESWRYILLPIYLSTYRYEGKTFQVMVNGQNGVIAGQKPVAWWKIWTAIAAMFAPGILLGLIGLLLLIFGGIGIIPLGIALVLVFAALFFSIWLYQKALDSEAA
ncbi:MAG: hypothetical protein HPY45_03525 [Anaerolineae bacterium]|nr:hypothetical protein [Anaerolineae bacterium]